MPDLSPTETKALGALARAPLGLASEQAVAYQAGLTLDEATRAAASLEDKGLARRGSLTGRRWDEGFIRAERQAEGWLSLSPLLRAVEPPERAPRPGEVVPRRLLHVFWNTAPSQLVVEHGGSYIAHRLLTRLDTEALAWGAEHLSPADWRQGSLGRGFPERVRALGRNLALDQERDRQRPAMPGGARCAVPVGSQKGLVAAALKAIGAGGTLRDYHDLWLIDEAGSVTTEDGLALLMGNGEISPIEGTLLPIVLGLGRLADVEDDEGLPVDRQELADWGAWRQARLIRRLATDPA